MCSVSSDSPQGRAGRSTSQPSLGFYRAKDRSVFLWPCLPRNALPGQISLSAFLWLSLGSLLVLLRGSGPCLVLCHWSCCLAGWSCRSKTQAEHVSRVAHSPVPPSPCAGATPCLVRGAAGRVGGYVSLAGLRSRTACLSLCFHWNGGGKKKESKKIKTLHFLSLVNIMRQICNLMILFFFFNETLLFEEVVWGDTVLLCLLTVRFQLGTSMPCAGWYPARRWLRHPTSPFLHVALTSAPTDAGLPWCVLTSCDTRQWLEESARLLCFC